MAVSSLGREFWGGFGIAVAWLAVLFVGIFGGDIDNVDAGGGVSSVPVVVVVAIAALFATASIARWALKQPDGDELRRQVEEQGRALERLEAQVEELRSGDRPAVRSS